MATPNVFQTGSALAKVAYFAWPFGRDMIDQSTLECHNSVHDNGMISCKSVLQKISTRLLRAHLLKWEYQQLIPTWGD